MPSNLRQLARRRKWWLPLFWSGLVLALLLLGAGSAPGRAAAEVPSAVDLLYFRGEGGDNIAYLEWETGTESDTAGFRLERANSVDGPYSDLDEIGFITASGSVSAGAYYEAEDKSAVNGQSYWYKLVEIALDNSASNEWTVRVSIDPEPTSQIIGGGSGTAAATSTPVPTSTSAATATGRPATNPTSTIGSDEPEPTNTPRPTETRPPTQTPRPAATTDGNNEVAVTTRTFSFTATPEGEDEGGVEAVGAPGSTGSAGNGPAATPAGAGAGAGAEAEADAEAMAGDGENAVAASAVEAAEGEEETPLLGGRTVGSQTFEEAGSESEANVAQQEGRSSSLLLWIGFIAAFFIFIGGIAFSIFLSTRKRENDVSFEDDVSLDDGFS